MNKPDGVSDTLFVPLEGRLYATERYPELLKDKELLRLNKQFPDLLKKQSNQTEYTLLASACRAVNLDNVTRRFLAEHPKGTVVNIGAGMETAFSRVDNGKVRWYDLDLPSVIEKRRQYICETERNKFIPLSVFDSSWMRRIDQMNPSAVLIIAAGLFYYFKEETVVGLIDDMKRQIRNVEIVFDAVCAKGLKRSNRFVKRTGNRNALMHFYVDKPEDFFKKINGGAHSIEAYPFYRDVLKMISRKCSFKTRLIMSISDHLKMVWVIHAKL